LANTITLSRLLLTFEVIACLGVHPNLDIVQHAPILQILDSQAPSTASATEQLVAAREPIDFAVEKAAIQQGYSFVQREKEPFRAAEPV